MCTLLWDYPAAACVFLFCTLFHFFRIGVRAWKPNSLVLRGGERELCRRQGRIFHFFRAGVRARKPNSLA